VFLYHHILLGNPSLQKGLQRRSLSVFIPEVPDSEFEFLPFSSILLFPTGRSEVFEPFIAFSGVINLDWSVFYDSRCVISPPIPLGFFIEWDLKPFVNDSNWVGDNRLIRYFHRKECRFDSVIAKNQFRPPLASALDISLKTGIFISVQCLYSDRLHDSDFLRKLNMHQSFNSSSLSFDWYRKHSGHLRYFGCFSPLFLADMVRITPCKWIFVDT